MNSGHTAKPASGGRRSPRTFEIKSRAADRLIGLMRSQKKMSYKPSRMELEDIQSQNKFFCKSKEEKASYLNSKLNLFEKELEALQDKTFDSVETLKRKKLKRAQQENTIKRQIEEVKKDIKELK